MNELKLFRPSWAPGVELCGHYEPSISTSPNALRGQRFHECMAKLWRGEYTLDDCPKDLWDPVDYTYGELSPLIGTAETKGVEELVPLYDEFDDFITEGTVDLWAQWTKPKPITVVVDYKTGQERDYWAQIYVYALSLCNKLGFDEVELILIFADQKRTFRQRVTRAQLEDRVWRIVANVENPKAPHTINRFCDYCDLRLGNCPAWEAEKTLAFRTVAQMDEGDMSLDVETARELALAPSFQTILNDPNLLGKFLIAYKRMRVLVEKVWQIEARAILQMEQGTQIPGVIKVDNPGADIVDAQKFIQLVRGDVDPNELLKIIKTVDNDMAREIFAKLKTKKPKIFGEAVVPTKTTAASSYIKVKE